MGLTWDDYDAAQITWPEPKAGLSNEMAWLKGDGDIERPVRARLLMAQEELTKVKAYLFYHPTLAHQWFAAEARGVSLGDWITEALEDLAHHHEFKMQFGVPSGS